MGHHSRKKWSNKHEVAVAITGTLRASYSGKSTYGIYASNNSSYAWLRQYLTNDAYQIVKSFTMYRDAPGGPIAYVNNLSSASFLLRSSFYVLQTLLGDFCLVRKYHCYSHSLLRCTWLHDTFSQIYRCSVVWQHNIWIIILPILLWISCAGKWAILWILNKGWIYFQI